MSVAAVICAAGASSRMNGIKKEYQQLKDKGITVLASSVRAFAEVPSVETIAIAVPPAGEEEARKALSADTLNAQKPKVLFTEGGDTRRASVYNALCLLAAYKPCYVLIHDGARPWITAQLIEKLIEEVKKHGAVIPLLPLTETPKECGSPVGEETVFIKTHLKRANTATAQTPQVFKFEEILDAHKKAAEVQDREFTDDAEIWSTFRGQVAAILGSPENKKITFREDIG
jgi:2-C-methyl-D-erythritol 4-phosphate cytidylyltransferase/2-C-methyl-D-erythritol 4-phosphate cytidylyltransferase/2-C-methyl-D-erythritol 2,4-cyclodiphosphate synthase